MTPTKPQKVGYGIPTNGSVMEKVSGRLSHPQQEQQQGRSPMSQVPSETYPRTNLSNQSLWFQIWCNTHPIIREIHEHDEGFRVSYINMDNDHTRYLDLRTKEELYETHI